MSHLSATLPVTCNNHTQMPALTRLFLYFHPNNSLFFKLCGFSMFDPEHPTSEALLPIHKVKGYRKLKTDDIAYNSI